MSEYSGRAGRQPRHTDATAKAETAERPKRLGFEGFRKLNTNGRMAETEWQKRLEGDKAERVARLRGVRL